MRMSQLFSQTLRDVPSEAEVVSHQLLLRAGFIRQMAAGIFSLLPLGHRSLKKIEAILRREMDAIGGQEVSLPAVHPAELWKESGRWDLIDAEMVRFQDRGGRDMLLAMTHEEAVTDLARREVRSYRDLPRLIYQIQTKVRDDPRPRAGLIRVREFQMKDSYSLDADWDGLDRQYRRHYAAYFNIFRRCGLPVVAVQADTGIMGGKEAHEFMYLTPIGEDTLLLCDACGHSANRQVAMFRKPEPAAERALSLEPVATPDTRTIDDLAALLDIPRARTAKAVFMMAAISSAGGLKEEFVFAVVRGDMEVNETKLANVVGARSLRPATEAEIRDIGAAPGYASPVGLKDVLVVADDAVPGSANLVAGANRDGYHLRNVNYGRDWTARIVADIAAAAAGDACPNCGAPLRAERGVEVGNIFKLGTRFSETMGCTYLDANGQVRPVIMGSYGIGLGRLLACVAEAHHDEHGLIWPVSVAPYDVHLTALVGKGSPITTQAAEQLYLDLTREGIETLYDDRLESPGVKFNDADLIGLPLRVTVGERGLAGGTVELKRRGAGEREAVGLEQIVGRVRRELTDMHREIEAALTPPGGDFQSG